MTQSDVTTSTGGSETPTSTRSSRAERNAAAADLDRSRGGFSANPATAVQLAEIEEVDPSTIFQHDGAGFALSLIHI